MATRATRLSRGYRHTRRSACAAGFGKLSSDRKVDCIAPGYESFGSILRHSGRQDVDVNYWALRVSNPRPPGCKPGALAAELSARARKTPGTAVPGLSLELHRIGAAAAAGAFAVRIGDAETAAVELVMEVDRGSGHV